MVDLTRNDLAILETLGYMGDGDIGRPFKVGDSARDLNDFEVAASTKVEFFCCSEKEVLSFITEWCKNINVLTAQITVVLFTTSVSVILSIYSIFYHFAYGFMLCFLHRLYRGEERLMRDSGNIYRQVDAIKERSRETLLVL